MARRRRNSSGLTAPSIRGSFMAAPRAFNPNSEVTKGLVSCRPGNVTDIPPPAEITAWLTKWRKGDEQARHRLVAVVYPQLRQIAARLLSRERRDHTLEPNAVVNELYLRLSAGNRSHTRTAPTSLQSRPRRCAVFSSTMHALELPKSEAVNSDGCPSRMPSAGAMGFRASSCSTWTPAYRSSNRLTLAPLEWWSCGSSADCAKRTLPTCCKSLSSRSSETGRRRAPGSRRGFGKTSAIRASALQHLRPRDTRCAPFPLKRIRRAYP